MWPYLKRVSYPHGDIALKRIRSRLPLIHNKPSSDRPLSCRGDDNLHELRAISYEDDVRYRGS
ncbi:hypothetical protein RvY_04529 [Ramazzottius varieornatus]|uniref:Uncharacterized protein n=1 Tax=Ramazzottius varieornatus TaxID=947166 RepID=A0A1D1USK4_RAMVA|nr:hypothetical protein RvY_04529 [Ramazzottius varieornatus]